MTFTIQRRTAKNKPWADTNKSFDADSANHALRQFGSREAVLNKRAKVVTGSKTGRQYRAVKAA